jgi:hypothetical protein
MSLLPVFHWFEATAVGNYGRHSQYFFPVIEVVHLLGLTLLLGSVLFVNLRLLGLAMRGQAVRDVARAVRPLLWTGAALSVGSGLLLFLAEAVKCYYNVAFWYKMALLFAAMVFQLAVHQRLSARTSVPLPVIRVTGTVSLVLWFGVGIAGRAIAFV